MICVLSKPSGTLTRYRYGGQTWGTWPQPYYNIQKQSKHIISLSSYVNSHKLKMSIGISA